MVYDSIKYKTQWVVRRYKNDETFQRGTPTEVIDQLGNTLPAESVIDGNLLLNEGIALVLDLMIGAGGTTFANANAHIGVGESTTAAGATQTGLLGATTAYVAVESGYPSRTNQTVTWRSIFTSAVANHAWEEFTVANGNSNAAVNLNRKVENQGVKASGQTWTLDVSVTLS
jgi:hypothetical protein